MQVFIFSYRENSTGELVEVRTLADNEKKALKAFKMKVPTVDVSQIESLNGVTFGDYEGGGGVPETKEAPQKNRPVAEGATTDRSYLDSKPENFALGIVGIICVMIGLYLLLISPGADTEIGVIVNLQKLSIGQTFSIVGAIFIAVQWRPR